MKIIKVLTVITAALPYIILAFGILGGNTGQSFATWLLWLILDLILWKSVRDQGGEELLIKVFCAGTFVTTIILIATGHFSWGYFETFVSGLVVICIIIFSIAGPYYGTIAGAIALTIAGIPQVYETILDPKSCPTLVYLLFATSSFLSSICARAWTVKDRLFSMSSMIYCLIVTLLSLR